MGDLTRNISRDEVACKCGCGFDTIDYETITVVQSYVDRIREHFSMPIYVAINSGCRCLDYNRSLGSKDTSQHVLGRAIDFYVYFLSGSNKHIISSNLVYLYLNDEYTNRFGIGNYDTFTHIDTKSGIARRW